MLIHTRGHRPDDDARDLAVVRDTWEDEDEEVKDAWDAEDEPSPAPVAAASVPITATKNKKGAKGGAETTAGHDAELNETPQERKARLERLVQERDLESAMSLFGISGPPRKEAAAPTAPVAAAPASPFDTLEPSTVAEFDQFTRIITKRLEAFEVCIARIAPVALA